MTDSDKNRRNAESTRSRILAAAQIAFADGGYDHVGIREIAGRAGVSSTILLRYFGSKAGLFEAALIASMPVEAMLTTERAGFGETLAQIFSDTDLDVRPPVLIGVTAGDLEARAITERVTERHMIAPLARWLGPPNARSRAKRIAMLATGYVVYARQLDLERGGGIDTATRDWFTRSIQAVVDDWL